VNYRLVIEQAAFQRVLEAAPRERRLLREILARLTETSFQEPDFKEKVEGREFWTRFFGPYSVTYWLDHAVGEVRVIVIFRD
jgi:hypothetical protein